MDKQKLSYFGHIMRTQDGLEKETVLGMTEDKRRRGRPRDRWLDRPRVEADDAAGADGTRRRCARQNRMERDD